MAPHRINHSVCASCLEEGFDRYLRLRRFSRLREATLNVYTANFRRFLRFAFEGKTRKYGPFVNEPQSAIDQGFLVTFQQALVDEGMQVAGALTYGVPVRGAFDWAPRCEHTDA